MIIDNFIGFTLSLICLILFSGSFVYLYYTDPTVDLYTAILAFILISHFCYAMYYFLPKEN